MKTEDIINQLNKFQTNLFVRGAHGVEPADPTTLANNLLLIRGLLVQLVDKVADAERQYRHQKAARYDGFIEKGMKKSPAKDALEFEADLIEYAIEVERLRGYMKYTDGLCSSIQSVLKVQIGSDKNQY
jgi:hypothetical protein